MKNVDQRSRLENEPQVQEITDIDNIATLHQLLQKGEVTAEQVVLAYIKRLVSTIKYDSTPDN